MFHQTKRCVNMNRFRIFTLIAGMVLGYTASVSAQDYEDDIYYNPDKAKKSAPTAPKTYNNANNYQRTGVTGAYPSADTYTQGAQSQRTISVDDYNRRGIFANDSAKSQVENTPDFAYTRRIEQFYNPDVVTSSTDPELAQYYYSEPATSVNIIVNNPYPSYWGYPYYGSAWAWANPYYNYWGMWDPWYGPNWSWNWGWNYPYRPGWSWGWGPCWGYRPGWGWAGTVRPNRPSGNIRPGYNTGTGNRRPGYSRPGYGTSRPGNNGYSRPGYNTGNSGYSRPGSSGNSGYSRPGTSNNGYSRPSNSGNSYRPGGSSTGSYRSGGSGYSRGGGGYSGGSSRGGGSGRGRH